MSDLSLFYRVVERLNVFLEKLNVTFRIMCKWFSFKRLNSRPENKSTYDKEHLLSILGLQIQDLRILFLRTEHEGVRPLDGVPVSLRHTFYHKRPIRTIPWNHNQLLKRRIYLGFVWIRWISWFKLCRRKELILKWLLVCFLAYSRGFGWKRNSFKLRSEAAYHFYLRLSKRFLL